VVGMGVHWNNRGYKSVVWRCINLCTSSTISEEALYQGVVRAINLFICGKDSFTATLQKNIETVLSEEFDQSTNEIDAKLEELQNELLRLANSKTAYDGVVSEIYRLRDLKQETLTHNVDRQSKRQRIAEMTEYLDGQSGVILEYDEKLVRKLIERVTVYDNRLVVEFMSGMEIEVNR
jgi:hypothetical protein